jgi:tRNA pseudouridine38-40 synthase
MPDEPLGLTPTARTAAVDSMQVDVSGIHAQLAVVLSYNGAPFAGFARQPGKQTVQGELERALSLALRRPVEVVCAGRTDAGVHARAQVVSFPVSREEARDRNLFKLKRSLQALTDEAIAIQTLALMPPDFSARFSALDREYRYLVVPGGRHPLFLQDWCWDARRDLDVDAMNEAAQLLVGEHDFKSFCLAASAEGKNTVRRLHEVRVVPVNVMGEDALSIRVTGTAFLHSMVRIIVGTLVEVGRKERDPDSIPALFEAKRADAGFLAPAQGLCLMEVYY